MNDGIKKALKSFVGDIFIWWIVLTFIYLAADFGVRNSTYIVLLKLVAFIGLFVPIGFWNAFYLGPYVLLFLLGLFVVFFFTNRMLKDKKLGVRILLNLLVLLLLTTAVDLIMFHTLVSWGILLHGPIQIGPF